MIGLCAQIRKLSNAGTGGRVVKWAAHTSRAADRLEQMNADAASLFVNKIRFDCGVGLSGQSLGGFV